MDERLPENFFPFNAHKLPLPLPENGNILYVYLVFCVGERESRSKKWKITELLPTTQLPNYEMCITSQPLLPKIEQTYKKNSN